MISPDLPPANSDGLSYWPPHLQQHGPNVPCFCGVAGWREFHPGYCAACFFACRQLVGMDRHERCSLSHLGDFAVPSCPHARFLQKPEGDHSEEVVSFFEFLEAGCHLRLPLAFVHATERPWTPRQRRKPCRRTTR